MKIQKRNDKGRGKKKHQTKKAPLIRLTCQHQIHVGSEQYRKKKKKRSETKKHKNSRLHGRSPLASTRRGASCSCSVFVLTRNGTRFRCANHKLYMTGSEIIYIYIYIKKQKTSSSVKTVIILRLTKKKRTFESSYYYYFCYHTESAISHQQWFQLTVPIAAQCHNTI